MARHIRVDGQVQGVGFRPFVLRLALRLGIRGWVRNRGGLVEIHAEGPAALLDELVRQIVAGAPPLARPGIPAVSEVEPVGYSSFLILESHDDTSARITLPPDGFVCQQCLAEMADPSSRRYRYPFTNCTQCGPRYTIIDRLPYDRTNTAMAGFPLCADCLAEYRDPTDRRYHAQPLACPACGPVLTFNEPGQPPVSGNEAALAVCIQRLQAGFILAVKGVGGYHLLCDARSDAAVQRLRERKHRPDRPLAIMLPEVHPGSEAEQWGVVVDGPAMALLSSPLRPIVLLPKATGLRLAESVAPGLAEIGCMLPYSPLHHLLLSGFGGPLVATSANISGEPVLIDASEVEDRLQSVADAFLHHNRPIRRPADDPVYRRIAGRFRPLRLGRGQAPLELPLQHPVDRPLLAVGGDLKNTIALALENRVIVSPHLGDLGATRSLRVFGQVVDDLCRLFRVRPEIIICDAHPDYFSSHWATGQGIEVRRVFHHAAHASAVWGEFQPTAPMLVFAWDGLGYGADGILWGGEALLGQPGQWRRVASLRPFRLIGGELASREPWRCALSMCLEAGLDRYEGPAEASLARTAWQRQINSPLTTSAGRLFDAAAALTGLLTRQSFEGHAAMLLEAHVNGAGEAIPLPISGSGSIWQGDWSPLLPVLMDHQRSLAERAVIFHESLAGLIHDQALLIRQLHGIQTVGLAGGVFQNRRLTESVQQRLTDAGFAVLLPECLPVNDAAIAFGQIVEVSQSGGM